MFDNGWIAGVVGHLPWFDRQVAAVRDLRHAGEDGTNLAIDLIPLLQNLHSGAASGGSGVIKELASLGNTEHAAISRALAISPRWTVRCRDSPEWLAVRAD